MKKYIFVLSNAAHTGTYLQETLDVILTTAAFDQSVAILLVDDAVFDLKQYQHSTELTFKDTSAIFQSLALYDVTNIYVELESMQAYGIQHSDLIMNAKIIDRSDVNSLVKQYDVVYSS